MTGTFIVANDPAACGVDVSIDAASVDTQNGMRDADLGGPDFFDATTFQRLRFAGKAFAHRERAGSWTAR